MPMPAAGSPSVGRVGSLAPPTETQQNLHSQPEAGPEDERIDGQTDGRKDGQMDGWMVTIMKKYETLWGFQGVSWINRGSHPPGTPCILHTVFK